MDQASQMRFRARVLSVRRHARHVRRALRNAVGRFASLWIARRTQWQREVRALLAMCAESALPQMCRPMVQNLEGRVLLSSATLVNGLLNITGDSGAANAITVDLGAGGTYYVNVDGHTYSPAASSVKSISITGGSGNDTVYINPSINVGATINTFNGNDFIRVGGAYDTITAGDGNDTVYGSGKITLGNGNDVVWVGSIGSSVTAGNGNDLLVGGPGNDAITAGSGRSTLIGGAGADVLTATTNASFPDATSQDKVVKNAATGSTGGSTGSTSGSGSSSQGSGTGPTIPSAPGGTVRVSGENETVYGSNHGDATAPTPVIVLLGNSGQAEQSVFVDGLSSTLGAGTVLNATFKWNFGDSNGAYNNLVGWNAGHIYNNPGTYTITLTITNVNGKTSSLSANVTVGANTRRTLYVDSIYGNDSNNGLSPSSPLKTGVRAQ